MATSASGRVRLPQLCFARTRSSRTRNDTARATPKDKKTTITAGRTQRTYATHRIEGGFAGQDRCLVPRNFTDDALVTLAQFICHLRHAKVSTQNPATDQRNTNAHLWEVGREFEKVVTVQHIEVAIGVRADCGRSQRLVLQRDLAKPRAGAQRGNHCRVIVLHDVSRLRHLETVRRDFVANVSHELRTPLSIILANTEMLLDGALDDPQAARRFLDSMHRSTRRLTALVSDLLDLSRLEAGSQEVPASPVKLSDVVHQVVDGVHAKIEQRDLKVSVAVPAGLIVMGDADAIEQVVLNLVDNAVKYTGEGGKVMVSAHRREDAIRVEVADDGPGVPEGHRPRLFERFYRVDPGRSREEGGTGLGLAIVKHLVNAMGGEVGMTSSPSGGALFWFELPVS